MRVTNIGQTFFGCPRPSNSTKTCLDVVLNNAKNQTCLKLYLKPERSTHHGYFLTLHWY